MQNDKIETQAQESNDGPAWWIIILCFLAGCAIPLANGTLRRQMMNGEIPFATVIGTGALGAAAASLLVIKAKIKNPVLRKLFLTIGIVVVAIGACMAMIMIME